MDDLPGMWRQELWHPKVVHFAVALLMVGTLLYVAFLVCRKRDVGEKFLFAARICLGIGVVSAFASLLTGDLADSVVGRKVCDPLVLEDHCFFAHVLTFLYALALGGDVLLAFVERRSILQWGRVLVVMALILGMGLVTYVGHLGGKLVYQQAAGVHVPSEDCEEFGE
jgi:uncharacterized membrane protein